MLSNNHLEHLRLLAIYHYMLAGSVALFSLMPTLNMLSAALLNFGLIPPPDPSHDDLLARTCRWIFFNMGSLFIIMGMSLAIIILLGAVLLSYKKCYIFCFVVAGLECLFMPLGTVLGIFTIIVLAQKPVRQIFQSSVRSAP